MSESEIDEASAQHLAGLARLRLSESERQSLQVDLNQILAYAKKLDEIDTASVSATTHAVTLPTKYRTDQVRPSLNAEAGLSNAPERIGDGFGVPKIIE